MCIGYAYIFLPACPLSMQHIPQIFCFLVLMFLSPVVMQALAVGAYWSFQAENEGAGPTNSNFTENVSVNTWPNGSPSFSYAGSRKWNFGNYGGNQVAFDGSSWISGRASAGMLILDHPRGILFKLR